MPERRSPDRLTFSKDHDCVGFDELFDATAEPVSELATPGFVLELACRNTPHNAQHGRLHPGWALLCQILLGEPRHAWRSVVLLAVLGIVICGILLAGSVALAATGTALVGLIGLLRLSRYQAGRARLI
ncbi:hypothetical protein ACWEF6_10590 [Amycolatopsis sp. NPDC004772]